MVDDRLPPAFVSGDVFRHTPAREVRQSPLALSMRRSLASVRLERNTTMNS